MTYLAYNKQDNNHPSTEIVGSVSNLLNGKKIVLCITGSVSAYKAIDLARLLMRHGAQVLPVMSKSVGKKFLTNDMMRWATGNKVVSKLTGDLEHISIANPGRSDLILVYPCTANTLSKFANGIDDSTVTTVLSVALGAKIPIMIAPAMHGAMYKNSIIKGNVDKIKLLGVTILNPIFTEDKAKIISPELALKQVLDNFCITPPTIQIKVLITAGSTVEHIDPIRVLTNLSSGKMGISIATVAAENGASVKLLYGYGNLVPPKSENIDVLRITNSKDLFRIMKDALLKYEPDIVIHTAAVSDYTVKNISRRKFDTKKGNISLEITPTKKIVDQIKKINGNVFLVAFKAEHGMSDEKLIDKAYSRLLEANCDLIIANDLARPGCGFGSDTNEVFVIDKNRDIIHLPLQSKSDIAMKLLEIITKKWARKAL
jgi:phosphopantothenoylcysteine decarboxylase / phosphopantothenate---cysteine ligase